MSFSGRTAEKLPSVLINGNARSHIWELRSQKWERSYIWVLMTIVPPTVFRRPYGTVLGFGRVFYLEHGLGSPDDHIDVIDPPVFLASGITKHMFGHFKTFLTVLSPPVSRA